MTIAKNVNRASNAIVTHVSTDATVEFLKDMLTTAIEMLPKTKKKAFIENMNITVGRQVTVKVESLMNGQEVSIPWDQVNTSMDPSQERYWSM